MQLVGATPSFVRGPFIVAGLAQGLLASVAAVALVEAARRGVFLYAGSNPLALLGIVAGGPLSASDSDLIVVPSDQNDGMIHRAAGATVENSAGISLHGAIGDDCH